MHAYCAATEYPRGSSWIALDTGANDASISASARRGSAWPHMKMSSAAKPSSGQV